MSDENLLTRREFTVESALAMLAGVTITISGCGDDDNPGSTPTPPPASGGKTGTVATAMATPTLVRTSRPRNSRLETRYH